MKKVSIIIPSYNAGAYIGEAVESALDQQVPLQLIVVDDGSSDQTRDILATYSDRIELISSDHAGVANARNRALSRLDGEYTLLLDADDTLRPGALGRLLDAASGGREIIYGKFSSWDAGMNTMLCVHRPGRMLPNPFVFLSRRNLSPPGSLIFPSSAFSEVGGFDQDVAGCEDWDFLTRLARSGYSFKAINRNVFNYRRHTGSASNQALRMYNAGAEVIRRCHMADERVRVDLYPHGNPVDALEDNLADYGAFCFALSVLGEDADVPVDILRSVSLDDDHDWKRFGRSFRQGLWWHSLSIPGRQIDVVAAAQVQAAEALRCYAQATLYTERIIRKLMFPDFLELLIHPGPYRARRLASEWLIGRSAKRQCTQETKCS